MDNNCRVKLSTDQKHGSAYGLLVWRGIPRAKPEKIGPALKRQWTLVETPDYTSFDGSSKAIEMLTPERDETLLVNL